MANPKASGDRSTEPILRYKMYHPTISSKLASYEMFEMFSYISFTGQGQAQLETRKLMPSILGWTPASASIALCHTKLTKRQMNT